MRAASDTRPLARERSGEGQQRGMHGSDAGGLGAMRRASTDRWIAVQLRASTRRSAAPCHAYSKAVTTVAGEDRRAAGG
jgi:hypothetical protein